MPGGTIIRVWKCGCAAVTAAGDFRGADPSLNWPELFAILQPLESRVHPAQRLAQLPIAQLRTVRVRNIQRESGNPPRYAAGTGRNGLATSGAPPLADRTVPDTAEMRLTQPQARFSGFFEGRPPKPQQTATGGHTRPVALIFSCKQVNPPTSSETLL